jgi:hypothetical protein
MKFDRWYREVSCTRLVHISLCLLEGVNSEGRLFWQRLLCSHQRSERRNLSLPPPAAPDRNHSLYVIDLYALVQPGTEVLLAVSADVDFSINPPQKWDCSTIGDGQSLSGRVGTCHHAIPQTGIRAPPLRNLLLPTRPIFQRA